MTTRAEYDACIAAAATAYVLARETHAAGGNTVTRDLVRVHYHRLAWIVQASRRGVDPDTYTPNAVLEDGRAG